MVPNSFSLVMEILVSMADTSVFAKSAEAAVYVSTAGRRGSARNAEAVVYVSMAGRKINVRRISLTVRA